MPALLDRPIPVLAELAAGAVRGGRVTLEERLNAVLHEARTNSGSECPLCRARMAPTPAGVVPAGAECAGCGSRLS